MQKNNQLLKVKRSLKPKYKLTGACLYIYLARGAIRPFSSRQLSHCSCSTQRSPVRQVGTQGVSNRDTHLCPLHHNSSVHLTTTEVRHSGRITDGMWARRATVCRIPTESGKVWKKILSFSSREEFFWFVRMEKSNFPDLIVLQNHRPCYPPMSNPSTSLWTAWPDGPGWWNNRMAAQHLPRDLVRSSSRLQELLKQWRILLPTCIDLF